MEFIFIFLRELYEMILWTAPRWHSWLPCIVKRTASLSVWVYLWVCLCMPIVVWHSGGERGRHFQTIFFLTMRVPARVAAVSCLCPLVVFLCVVSQSCYGTQVNLSPHANPNPSLYPNQRLRSDPTPIPSKSPDQNKTPLMPSQHYSTSQNVWGKLQLKPRLDTMFYLTDYHMPNTPNFAPATSQAASSSNSRLKQRQGLPYKSTSEPVLRNNLNTPKQASKINPKANPKPRLGSLLQPQAGPNSKVTGSKTNSVSLPSNKLSSLTSPHQSSNTSGNINYTTYNSRPAALSNPKSHTKLRPSSQTNRNGKSDSRGTNTYSRAQKNQTKLFDTDKDSHHRPKRGWIWNQFFVLEEHIGPEPQYIGKVRYLYFFSSSAAFPSLFSFFFINMFWADLCHLTK